MLFDHTGRFVQVRLAIASYLWDLRTNLAGRIESTTAFQDGVIPLGGPERVISTVRIP